MDCGHVEYGVLSRNTTNQQPVSIIFCRASKAGGTKQHSNWIHGMNTCHKVVPAKSSPWPVGGAVQLCDVSNLSLKNEDAPFNRLPHSFYL